MKILCLFAVTALLSLSTSASELFNTSALPAPIAVGQPVLVCRNHASTGPMITRVYGPTALVITAQRDFTWVYRSGTLTINFPAPLISQQFTIPRLSTAAARLRITIAGLETGTSFYTEFINPAGLLQIENFDWIPGGYTIVSDEAYSRGTAQMPFNRSTFIQFQQVR